MNSLSAGQRASAASDAVQDAAQSQDIPLGRGRLRLSLLLLPAGLTLLLTVWGFNALQQRAQERLRQQMEQTADQVKTLIQLRLWQIEQLMRAQVQRTEEAPAALHSGATFEWVGLQEPWRSLRVLPVGEMALRGVRPANSQILSAALRAARSSAAMETTEMFLFERGLDSRTLAQFVYPGAASGPASGTPDAALVMTLDLDWLLESVVGPDSGHYEIVLLPDEASPLLSRTHTVQVRHQPGQSGSNMYARIRGVTSTRVIRIGTQAWLLQLQPTALTAPAREGRVEQAVLVAGAILTLILGLLGGLLWRSRMHAEVLAERKTREFLISQSRFQRAVSGTQDGVWDYDVPENRSYFSPRLFELLGFEENLAVASFDWLAQRVVEPMQNSWRLWCKEWLAQGQQFEVEVQLRREDGGAHWFRVRGQSLVNAEGEVSYMSGALSDIQVEKDAALREELMVNLTESSPDVIMAFDLEGKVLYMNNAGLQLFGSDQINAMGVTHLFSQEDVSVERKVALPQGDSASVWGGETELITTDGRVIPVSQVIIGHRGNTGAVEYYSTVLRDISVIKQGQDALRELSDRFERALNASNDGVFERRVGEDRMTLSPRFKQILGHGPDMPESREFIYNNMHPEDQLRFLAMVREKDVQGGKWSIEIRVRDQFGVYHWLHSRGEVLLDAEGKPELYSGVWTNIDERKQLEDELRQHRDNLASLVEERTARLVQARDEAQQANQVKSEFLANMSHELRTPMHAILSFARFGVEKWDRVELAKLKHWFENIYTSGSRLLDLLNNLLDLSKLEAGKMQLDLRVQETVTIARDLLIEFEALAKNKELQINLDLPLTGCGEPLATLAWVDTTRFMQVLRNLLSNAIKFSPTGTLITLRWSVGQMSIGRRATDTQQVEALIIEVSDQGMGIPEDELESVFDKFIQSSKTKSGAGGTGLGLSICREIMLAHHGTLIARNNTDVGATFEIRLPLIDPETVWPKTPEDAAEEKAVELI